VTLERLLVRDGLSFDEAVTTLQTNHNCPETRDALREMCAQFPDRMPRKVSGDDELAAMAQHAAVNDARLDRSEDEQIVARVDAALSNAIAALPPRDQLILKLRFENDMKIADISRLVDIPVKPLYRELSNIVRDLRERLRQEGIDGRDIERVVGNPAVTLSRALEAAGGLKLEAENARP
jgi:DNA-directed RNA polymerase specialized sigma subunit